MSINLIPDKDEVEFFWWRNLGFLSGIIGLLSYLLSSSFHFIFGELNTWKTLLYIFLSLILSYGIFFVKTWKPLQNLLFRSHLAFLFLLLSSIYSYFYDKFVKEKPDMFSLLSTGSFALTSLSLKRQNIQLGFEDDLLKFFLGFLTIQLMKVNLLLALVGAALCYFAIVLIPWSLDSPLETVSCITALQENVAIKIDTPASDLRKQLCSTQLGIVNDSENPERFVYPSDFESRLNDAIASGLVEECYDAFITWRKQLLNDQMTTMGFQNLSINEVPRLPIKTLKNDIEEWTKACHLVVKTLFPQERRACSVVFSALSPRDELSFMEVCRGITTQLLNYAKAVSTTTLSPERLFRIVDVLDTLEEILPDMESLFRNKICEFLYDEAIAVSKRLGETITGVFKELENLIRQDPAKLTGASRDGLHPTNRYVMNYLRAACQCRKQLVRVFEGTHVSSLPSSSSSPSLSEQMLRIVDLLETNLEANSKIYDNDPALGSFFMMSNTRYIVQNTMNTELADLLGGEWLDKHFLKVNQYHETYQKSSCDRLLKLLSIDSDKSLVQSQYASDRFELFKSQFEKICENQSPWVIFDDHLRNIITSSLRRTILHAHEIFMTKFLNDVETGDFGVPVIDGHINQLFLGKDEHTNPSNIQPTWTVVLPSAKDFNEWEEYGEKTILSWTHPRKYWWCIYRNDQGCRATKHVRQIQEKPRLYKIRYSGFHTCCFQSLTAGL